MKVTALGVFVAPAGRRRARLCVRDDGLFQFVTESLMAETEEEHSYWINDYPPSGLFGLREDALAALMSALPGVLPLGDVEPCRFDTSVGTYPEPVPRASA